MAHMLGMLPSTKYTRTEFHTPDLAPAAMAILGKSLSLSLFSVFMFLYTSATLLQIRKLTSQ